MTVHVSYVASGSVDTGVGVTLIDITATVSPSPARLTAACVPSLAVIGTASSVQTWRLPLTRQEVCT